MASSTVCRNLFGSVDHVLLQEELRKRMEQMMKDDRQRWNFDFLSYTPLPGGFEWEETSAVSFYQEECKRRNQEDGLGTDQEKRSITSNKNQENVSITYNRNQENQENQENVSIIDQENISITSNRNQEHISITSNRNQKNQENISMVSNKQVTVVCRKRTLETRSNTRITDFFPKRRKSSESRSVLTLIHSPEAAFCKTIR